MGVGDATLQDFVGTYVAPSYYSISGTIHKSDLTHMGGVNLATNHAQNTVTIADGTFQFSNLGAGSYIITPSKTGYTFAPTHYDVTLGPDSTARDFTSTATPPSSDHVPLGQRINSGTADFNILSALDIIVSGSPSRTMAQVAVTLKQFPMTNRGLWTGNVGEGAVGETNYPWTSLHDQLTALITTNTCDIQMVTYDCEGWDSTPASESGDIVSAMADFVAEVHTWPGVLACGAPINYAAGAKGVQMVNQGLDVYIPQMKGEQLSATSPASYATAVAAIHDPAHAANSSLLQYLDMSMRPKGTTMPAATVLAYWQAAKARCPYLTGIWMSLPWDSAGFAQFKALIDSAR